MKKQPKIASQGAWYNTVDSFSDCVHVAEDGREAMVSYRIPVTLIGIYLISPELHVARVTRPDLPPK